MCRNEPPREEASTDVESGVGATSERWAKPLRREATMVREPLWEEATMAASADVEGCERELSRSVQSSFLREPF